MCVPHSSRFHPTLGMLGRGVLWASSKQARLRFKLSLFLQQHLKIESNCLTQQMG